MHAVLSIAMHSLPLMLVVFCRHQVVLANEESTKKDSRVLQLEKDLDAVRSDVQEREGEATYIYIYIYISHIPTCMLQGHIHLSRPIECYA